MYISSNMRCTSRAGEGIGVGVLSRSLAADKYLLLVCQSSGKEISASPFGQFQSFAQFGHGGGEVAHGEVRLFLGSQHLFHFFLAEAAGGGPRCRGGCWDAVFPPYTMRRGCGMHWLSARRHSVRRGMISVEGCRGMHAPSPAGG